MGVGVICPRCRSSFPFNCYNCSSYDIVLYEDFEPLKYFQNRTVFYFKCKDCSSEFDVAICPDCSNKIFPEPPFVLGDKASGNKGCFIATACLGENSHITAQLYTLRDELLDKFYIGKMFIKYYYKYSPGLAHQISQSTLLQILSKYLVVYPAYYASLAAMKLLSVFYKKT